MSQIGALEGAPVAVIFGPEFGPTTAIGSLLFNASLGAMMRSPDPAMRQALKDGMGDYVKARTTVQAYKANP